MTVNVSDKIPVAVQKKSYKSLIWAKLFNCFLKGDASQVYIICLVQTLFSRMLVCPKARRHFPTTKILTSSSLVLTIFYFSYFKTKNNFTPSMAVKPPGLGVTECQRILERPERGEGKNENVPINCANYPLTLMHKPHSVPL